VVVLWDLHRDHPDHTLHEEDIHLFHEERNQGEVALVATPYYHPNTEGVSEDHQVRVASGVLGRRSQHTESSLTRRETHSSAFHRRGLVEDTDCLAQEYQSELPAN
jgi:hypothetical protein